MIRMLAIAALMLAPIVAQAQGQASAQDNTAVSASPAETMRAERAAALGAALSGSAEDRAAWLERWGDPASREALAETLEQLARPDAQILRTDLTRSFDRLILAGGVRADLFASSDDPARIAAIYGLPVPTPYDQDVATLDLPDDAALVAAIDRRVRHAAERDDFSGAVLVVRNGEPVYAEAFGIADRDHDVANMLETRFHLGSMDKMFTAVAIGQLIEQGRLSFDDTLAELLPDYPNREAAQAITVRHLLTHTAGLGTWFGRENYDRDARYERMTDWLPVFAAEPLEFEPGSRASYANEGFIVLGAIVEAVTGESWYDYVEANIFDRAGMEATGYPTLDGVFANRAVGYLLPPGDPYDRSARRANWMFLGYRGGSPGGGYSTVGDMTAFLTALRDGRLVSAELLEQMTVPFEGGLRNYGMGFQSEAKAGRSLRGHDGGGPGSGINSEAMIVWETGDVYAVLGNYDAPFTQELAADIGMLLARAGDPSD